MNIKYRLGTNEDLTEICDIYKSAIKLMNSQEIYQWDEIYPNEDILKRDIDKKELFVGILSGKIAVIYVLNKDCDEEYNNGNWKNRNASYFIVHRLCVNPVFQNCGLGKETMKHIESNLKKNGIESIRLDAFINNPYALKLYKRMGYSVVGCADWRKGRFYLMEKYL